MENELRRGEQRARSVCAAFGLFGLRNSFFHVLFVTCRLLAARLDVAAADDMNGVMDAQQSHPVLVKGRPIRPLSLKRERRERNNEKKEQ